MATRTTERLVTFAAPFRLAGFDEDQAAGTYRVVEDEEEILGLSFLAWQRVRTTIHIPAVSTVSTTQEVVPVDPDELERALSADAAGRAPDAG